MVALFEVVPQRAIGVCRPNSARKDTTEQARAVYFHFHRGRIALTYTHANGEV